MKIINLDQLKTLILIKGGERNVGRSLPSFIFSHNFVSLLCLSHIPHRAVLLTNTSRPTPLKTFEQHLSAALWGLGRGLSPFAAPEVLSSWRALSLSLSFHYLPFLALPTVEGPFPSTARAPLAPLANYEVPSSVYVCYRVV